MDPRLEKKLFIVICLLLVIFIGLMIFYALSTKENTLSYIENDKSVKHNLNIYKNSEGFYCVESSMDCQQNGLAIEVLTDEAELLDVTIDGKFVLYNDATIKLYDVVNDKQIDIELTGYDAYKIGYDEEICQVSGIIYYGDKFKNLETGIEEYETIGFYNISNNKKIYEGLYDELSVINDSYIEGKIIDDTDEKDVIVETFLLDAKEEKIILRTEGMCESFKTINGYIIQSSGCIGLLSSTIYTSNLQKIVTNLEDYKWSINSGDLYVINENEVNKYNNEGNIIWTSLRYENILQVIKDYIVYIDNDKLMITNENDVLLEISDWSLDYNYDSFTSGYRDGDLEFKEGIYLNYYIEDDIVSYYFDENIKSLSLIN